jgi:hypothetical protein
VTFPCSFRGIFVTAGYIHFGWVVAEPCNPFVTNRNHNSYGVWRQIEVSDRGRGRCCSYGVLFGYTAGQVSINEVVPAVPA